VNRKQMESYLTSWKAKHAAVFMQHQTVRNRRDARIKAAIASGLSPRNTQSFPYDPFNKIYRGALSRIANALGCRYASSPHLAAYLAADPPSFRAHLIRLFKGRMHISNHGGAWEMHHVVPISRFDLSIEDQRVLAFHFTNIAPVPPRWHKRFHAKEASAVMRAALHAKYILYLPNTR